MSVAAQLPFTFGGLASRMGWKLHHFFRRSSVVSHEVALVICSFVGGFNRGSGAPIAIQRSKFLTTAAESFGPSFGIFRSFS